MRPERPADDPELCSPLASPFGLWSSVLCDSVISYLTMILAFASWQDDIPTLLHTGQLGLITHALCHVSLRNARLQSQLFGRRGWFAESTTVITLDTNLVNTARFENAAPADQLGQKVVSNQTFSLLNTQYTTVGLKVVYGLPYR